MSTEPLKICNECKGPIVDTSRRRFCSVACMRAWHNTNAKKPTAAVAPKEPRITSRPTCPFCHKPMSPQASTYGAYCSELCRHKAAEDNDEEVQQVKAAEKPVAAAMPTPAQHKGICKKCNIFFTTKTLPVRMYCTDECRRQALRDGDFKHKPAAVVEGTSPSPSSMQTPTVPTTSPTPPRRGLGDIYVATKSKLRCGLVAVLQGALNKLTT